jgi:hypothetical protein
MAAPRQPWPDAMVEQMRQMRADGRTIDEIAQALRRSPRTVRDKISQLKLPLGAANPVQRLFRVRERQRPQRPQRAGKTTLPPLGSLE